MASEKAHFSPDTTEFEVTDHVQKAHSPRLAESARLGVTVLTLLMAMTIVGTSGDSLAVYNKTHVSDDFLLPLWPFDFNLGPTVALVSGGSIIVVSSLIALVGSKTSAIRDKALIHALLSVIGPLAGLIAAIVATSFFYSINTSNTVETVQSWSCRWSEVTMTEPPHFGILCKESKAALYMMITLIPLELIALGIAGWAFISEKKSAASVERKGSPALS